MLDVLTAEKGISDITFSMLTVYFVHSLQFIPSYDYGSSSKVLVPIMDLPLSSFMLKHIRLTFVSSQELIFCSCH